MSAKNRGDRIQQLHKVVTKHYTAVPPAEDRSVLEHLVYACCLESATYEAADEAFNRLRECSSSDWNDVRVTTITELREYLHNLPNPAVAAQHIKKNLQSLFETRYSFDIDDMVKMNLGKAVQELENLGGVSKFVLGFVTQNALGGHAIPVNQSIMNILLATEIVNEAEAAKGQAPGLERTVPKTKGAAFASCLHQFAIAVAQGSDPKLTNAVLKECGATAARIDALDPKASSPPPSKPAKKKVAPKKAAAKEDSPTAEAASKPAAKPSSKKTAAKKPAAAKKATKEADSSATTKSSKRKPR
ncbi:hypothetical protein [Aureliella helgolandensis]|uniref:Uncharacterized protein n=1 Tax=Aureliella helgolandensis TaxID=2527968 RepID=A0A518GGP6_9BACT|nr:hypothetical protein [Aureliella helgolandensis]QDV27772.1 hypothetical protein Q31a_61650 [Aureliella helgolandensis]